MGVLLDPRFVAVCLATFVGGFMRGFVGFGGALVALPVIALAYDPRIAVAAMSVMGIPSILQLLPEAVRTSERPIVIPISVAIFLSAPLGTLVLVSVSPQLMKIVISGLVVFMVAMLMRGWRLEQEVKLPVLIGAGIASGIVQGAAGIGGPPAVAVMLSRDGTPAQQRGNVLAAMTAVSTAALLPLWFFGVLTQHALIIGLMLAPIYVGSTVLGSRYFALGGARHFRSAAMLTLVTIGVVTLLTSVRDYFLT